MIQIRQSQMEALTERQWEDYHRQLMDFFRETTPDAVAHFDDEELLAIVARGVRKARSYGVESGASVAEFVGLTLLFGPEFDNLPDVRRFLKHPDLDPDLKVRLLSDLISQRLRTQAI